MVGVVSDRVLRSRPAPSCVFEQYEYNIPYRLVVPWLAFIQIARRAKLGQQGLKQLHNLANTSVHLQILCTLLCTLPYIEHTVLLCDLRLDRTLTYTA